MLQTPVSEILNLAPENALYISNYTLLGEYA
jgi:hypothetical protein